MKARNALAFCVIGIGLLIFLQPVQRTTAQGTLSVAYYGDPGCGTCLYLKGVVEDFINRHPDVSVTYTMANYYTNTTRMSELKVYYAAFGLTINAVPVAVLNDSHTLQALYAENLNSNSLEFWYIGALQGDITLWGTFVLGLTFGGTACLLLMMSLIGTSLITVEERKRYFAVSIGLIFGLIAAYTAILVIYIVTLQAFAIYSNIIVYILDGIMLMIGLWQIIEYRREDSTIFGTPTRVKVWLKKFVEKRSGVSAFLLGALFALVKIPCLGGVFIGILGDVWQNPLLIYYVLLYYAGMILPIVVLLIMFRLGMRSEKVNKFREKNRAYLRLASGIILLTLTLYLIISQLPIWTQ